MKKPVVRLPDIEDDAAFTSRLQSLASKILPGHPELRKTDVTNNRTSGIPYKQTSGTARQAVASQRDEIEAKRGPKKRYEYVLPVRVGTALADDARKNGVSATVRLLQVLRKAGYPVIQEDLIDLRSERVGNSQL